MTKAPVTSKIHQSFDVHGYLGPKFTLNTELTINGLADIIDFIVRQLICMLCLINFQTVENFICR